MAHRRVLHEVFSRGHASYAGLAGAGDCCACAFRRPTSYARLPGTLPQRHHGCPGHCFLQKRPRGDDGDAQGPRVYFLGTLTRHPEVRYAPNGMAVARCGVAVPTRLRQGDTWHVDVCRIEWWPLGPTPKRWAPRCAKAVASSSKGVYSGAGSRRGRPAAPVRSLSSASRCCPASAPTSRR